MSFYNPYSKYPDLGGGMMDLAQLFLMYKMMMDKKKGKTTEETTETYTSPTKTSNAMSDGQGFPRQSGQAPMMPGYGQMPDQNSLQNIFRLMSFMGGPLGR